MFYVYKRFLKEKLEFTAELRNIWKKDFWYIFFFFNGFTLNPHTSPPLTHTHPLNSQNLLTVTKNFSQWSLKREKLLRTCTLVGK